jgi:murein DD-endopeptidase MepM/ murein hydrolase activator NlpD
LADFVFAQNNDFSLTDSKNNFLVINSKEEFYQKLSGDFLFPIRLEQQYSQDNVVVNNQEDKKNVAKVNKNKHGWNYIVKKGESLWEISKKFKIPLQDLFTYNNLTENSIIKAGDSIVIPGVKPSATFGTNIKQFAGKFVSALNEVSNFIIPVSGFNWGQSHAHNGTDIAAPCGSEVYASQSGTVVESSDGWNGGYGNYIIIAHKNGSYTLYGHLNLRIVNIGDEVEKGELIGYVGNTGYTIGATGCHLHFEVRGSSNPLLK